MRGLNELAADQPGAVAALRAALRAGRLHHAVLILGASAAARVELALALGRALLCSEAAAGDGCGHCSGCVQAAARTHPDLAWLSPEGRAGPGVDAVRAATHRLAMRPQVAAVHLVVFPAAEQLAPAAQNALLKALEEPGTAGQFVLCAPSPRSVLPTVRSRCLRLQLTPRPPAQAAARLLAGGVPAALAPLLAWRFGDDVAAALPHAEALAAIWARLGDRGAADMAATEISQAAAELGADAERYDVALTLLELGVRDTLASAHGAGAAHAVGAELGATPAAAARAAALLRAVRRRRGLNASRPLTLETVLTALVSPA